MAYTSNDEFDAERRVQLTNEVRPLDIYEGVHSTLKRDIWQWLLGWTDVTTDLKYDPRKEDENDEVHYDKNYNVYNDEYPAKIVNGKVAEEYGEKTAKVWDPKANNGEGAEVTVGKSGLTHMEIDGVILPEHDLFLHEIYRYLYNLYPDHPDWTKLLTHNEIVDAFENAAAMVDYKPNDKFFILAAQNMENVEDLETASYSEQDAVALEEFKLLLRNLTNNATRRKFYGANDGLKMFASGIGELSSCFPVGEYLPLVPVSQDEREVIENIKNTDNTEAYLKRQQLDVFDPNYRKPFRIIDWTGKSRDFDLRDERFNSIFAFTNPGKERFLVEAHDPSDALPEATSAKNELTLKTLIRLPELSNSISYLQDTDNEKSKITTEVVTKDGELVGWKSDTAMSNKRIRFEILQEFPVRYATCYGYNEFTSDTIDFTKLPRNEGLTLSQQYNFNWPKDDVITEDLIYDKYSSKNTSCTSFYSLVVRTIYEKMEGYNEPVEIKYFFNDTANGISLSPREMLKLYPTEPQYIEQYNAAVRVEDPQLDFTPDFPIQRNMVISSAKLQPSNKYSLSRPTTINNGIISFECESRYDPHSDKEYPSFFGEWDSKLSEGANYKSALNSYGIILQLDDNNLVALEGSLRISWRDTNRFIEPKNVQLFIEAIPEEKSDKLCELIYPDWGEITDKEKQIRKQNKSLICKNKSYVKADGTIGYYESIAFSLDAPILNIYEMNAIITPSKEITFGYSIPEYLKIGKSKVTDIDLGYISLLRQFESDGFTISRFSFDSIGQLFEKEVLLEDKLKKYYNTKIIDIDIADTVGQPLKKQFPILEPKLDFIKNKEFDRNGEDYFSLTPQYLWDNFMHEAVTNNGKPIILSENVPTSRLDILASREKFISAEDKDTLYTLIFKGEENLRKLDSLSIGDVVEGNGLEAGTFIVEKGANSVRLNHQIPKAGDFVYKFFCTVEAYPTDISEDFRNYKLILKENGSLETTSPFDHGLWGSNEWPNVSESYINGLVDPQDFKPYNKDLYNFQKVMDDVYDRKITKDSDSVRTNTLLPSTVTLGDSLFYELHATKLLNLPNHSGHVGNLMNVEWLDYLDNNLNTVTQASEKTNVGVNLMMQTDASDFYSQRKDAPYTDDNLHIKFQTFNCSKGAIYNRVPCYLQIGDGGENYEKYFKLPKNVIKPNVYGASFFDHPIEGMDEKEKELEKNGGHAIKRFVYSKDDTGIIDPVPDLSSVDRPVFELPLGEYDIQKTYSPLPYEDDPEKKLLTDTISASFSKQVFKDLTQKLPDDTIKVINGNSISMKLFETTKKVKHGDNYEEVPINTDIVYCGEWDPNINKNQIDFIYPEVDEDWDKTKSYYYSIFNGTSKKVGDKIITFKNCDLLYFKYNNFDQKWHRLIARPKFSGVELCFTDKMYYEPQLYTEKVGLKETKTYDMVTTAANSKEKKFFDDDTIKEDTDTKQLIYKAAAAYTSCILDEPKETAISEEKKNTIRTVLKRDDFNIDVENEEETIVDDTIRELPIVGFFSKDAHNISYYALDYNENTGLFISRKIAKGLFSSSIEYDTVVRTTEFNTYIGAFKTLFVKNKDTGDFEIVNNITSDLTYIETECNTYKLPRPFITDGSYDISFRLDPKFISKGYLYEEAKDGTISKVTDKEVNFNVSQNKIMYDDENQCFYTYADIYKDTLTDKNLDTASEDDENKTEEEKKEAQKEKFRFVKDEDYEDEQKVALKFEEQKFYKDAYFFTAKYQKVDKLQEKSSELESTATLSPVKGLPLTASLLSSSDRIQAITEVHLRSIYSTTLEPSTMSNYAPLDGEIYGVTEDKNVLIGSIRQANQPALMQKSIMAANIKQNFEYVSEQGVKSPITKNYFNYKTPDENDVSITAPVIKETVIKRPLGQDDLNIDAASYESADMTQFKFFKNYLVFKGSIYLDAPSRIRTPFDGDPKFQDVLTTVLAGDKVVQAIMLNSNGLELRKSIRITDPRMTLIPDTMQYERGIFAVVCSIEGRTDIFTSHIENLSSIDTIRHFDNYITLQKGGDVQSFRVKDDGQIECVVKDASGCIYSNEIDPATGASNENLNMPQLYYDEIEVIDPKSPDPSHASKVKVTEDTPLVIPLNQDDFRPGDRIPNIFTGENEVVKAKDLALVNIQCELQSRDVFGRKVDGVVELFNDQAGNDVLKQISGSTLDPVPTSSEIIPVKESAISAIVQTNPYTINHVIESWYDAKLAREVLLRGDGHIFIKSPVQQVQGEYSFAPGEVTKNSYWTYGKIPSLLDTLELSLDSASPEDISKHLQEAMRDYKDFLVKTINGPSEDEAYAKAEEEWKKEHPDDGDYPEPKPEYTPYSDLTPLQQLHCDLVNANQFSIYTWQEFKEDVERNSKSNTLWEPHNDLYKVPLVADTIGDEDIWRVKLGASKKYKIERTPIQKTPLSTVAFREYAFDWIRHILGGADNFPGNYILSGEVKLTKILGDRIYVLLSNNRVLSYKISSATTSDNISDPRKWSQMNLPPDTLYSAETEPELLEVAEGPTVYYETTDGRKLSSGQTLVSDLKTTFDIDEIYTHENTLLYCGEYESVNDIQKNYRSDIPEREENTIPFSSFYGRSADKNTMPAILYSTDGNRNIKVLEIFDLLKDKEYGNTETCGVDKDIKIDSITSIKGNVYVSFLLDEKTEVSQKLKLSFVNGMLCDTNYDDPDLRPQWVSEEGMKTLLHDGKTEDCQGGLLTCYQTKKCGAIHETRDDIDAYTFDYTFQGAAFDENPDVVGVTQSEIILGAPLMANIESEGQKIDFLFALKTLNPVTNQFKYFEYDTSTAKGIFDIKTQEEVDGPSDADKMYSYRDAEIHLQEDDTRGYPSTEEDAEKKIYYEYNKKTGELRPFLNSRGGRIYKCNLVGEILLATRQNAKDRTSEACFVDIKDGNININAMPDEKFERTFAPAGSPIIKNPSDVENNMDYLMNDEAFAKFFKRYMDFISYSYNTISQDTNINEKSRNNFPYVLIENNFFNENYEETETTNWEKFVTDYLMRVDTETYVGYVKNFKDDVVHNTFTLEQFKSEVFKGEDELKKNTIRYIEAAITFLESREGPWGTSENKPLNWYDRITTKLVPDVTIDGKEVFALYDTEADVFMLNVIRYISSKAEVGYKTNRDLDIVTMGDAHKFNITKTADSPYTINEEIDHFPISGVMLSVVGYGGELLGRKSIVDWDNTETHQFPWEVDPEAFITVTDEKTGETSMPDLFNSQGDPVYLYNEYGRAITIDGEKVQMKVPKYKNFNELISVEGREIEKSGDSYFTLTTEQIEKLGLLFKGIDTKKNIVSLNKLLMKNELEPLNSTILRFKVLTVADTPAPKEHLNDPNYLIPVKNADTKVFGPNRVYFNPLGIPAPVVPRDKIENPNHFSLPDFYRSENQYAFYKSNYTNKNGKLIYECQEDGSYIKYVSTADNTVVQQVYQGTEDTDQRFNPSKPIYDTCEDWFKIDFYSEAEPLNPFWQIARIYPRFDRNLKRFLSVSDIYEWRKAGGTMTLHTLEDDMSYVQIRNTSTKKYKSGDVSIEHKSEFIDLKDGKVLFVLAEPKNQAVFKNTEKLVKYGISYINSFYEKDGLLKNVWIKDTTINIPATATLNYTVNTCEDLSDPTNRDASIARITELGLFDKFHKMVAYAHFPPIEYRTDTQHISFTCFINYNPCVDYHHPDKNQSAYLYDLPPKLAAKIDKTE